MFLRSIKLRNWIFLIFTIKVIVKQALTLSTVQNINLLNHVTPVTSPTTLSVTAIQFGSDQKIFYLVTFDADAKQRVRQYQIMYTVMNGQIIILTKTYLLAHQLINNNKLTSEVPGHLIIYSQSSSKYQVFNLATDNSFVGYDDGLSLCQFLYSVQYQLVILIKDTGQLQAIQYSSFILNNFTAINIFYTGGTADYVQAKISYDGQYLAVGSFNTGLVKIYQMSTLSLLSSQVFQNTDATKFVWDPNNVLYFYSQTVSKIYKFTLGIGFQYISLFLPSDDIYCISFSYAAQANQILIFYVDNNDMTKICCSTFSLNNLTVANTFYFNYDTASQSIYGPKFSYNSSSTVFYALICSNTFYKRFQVVTAIIISNNTNTTNTNSTVNNTLNATGNLNSTNLTNSSLISNLTNSSLSTTNSSFNSSNSSLINNFTSQDSANFIKRLENLPVYQNYKQLMSNSLNSTFLQYSNQAPASRKIIKPIFAFFSNFDDLWLYSYHHKNYHPVLTQTFSVIRNLQVEKWNTFNYEQIYQNLFEFNVSQIRSFFSNEKLPYSSQKFIEIQNDSNGYISNTLNFYFQCLIILIVTFVIGRLVFFLLSYWKWKLKNLFIQFSFIFYFVIICLEGNVQYMSYLFGFEMKTLFHKTFTLKGLSCMIILMQFLFLFIVFCIYYLIKYAYKSKSNNLLENCSATKFGIFYLTLQLGIRNVALGFAHMFFQNQNKNSMQIAILLLIESTFLGFNVYFSKLKKSKCFIKKSRQWILIFTTSIRILLVSTFLFQVDFQQIQIQFSITVFTQIYSILLISYMTLWPFSIFLQLFTSANQFISIIEETYKKSSNSQLLTQKCSFSNKQACIKKSNEMKKVQLQNSNFRSICQCNQYINYKMISFTAQQQKNMDFVQNKEPTKKNEQTSDDKDQKLNYWSINKLNKNIKQKNSKSKANIKLKRNIKVKTFNQLKIINIQVQNIS